MNFSFFKNNLILFYGSNGWIGKLFIYYLKNEGVKIVEGTARLENIELLKKEIETVKPTHVVSFTGRTHGKIKETDGSVVEVGTIDYLEYPGKLVENIRDNLFGPMNLAIVCKKLKIHYTYLGTGCIFNSSNFEESFDEESKPNYFGSGYSIVKGFTDQLMKSYPVLNLRIRMPIHSLKNDRNFITKITKYDSICSILNSMTVLDDFFPIFKDLILKKKVGTYNCVNPGTVNHNQILEMYKDLVDSTFTWKNMSIEEQSKILKSSRSNNKLSTKKIKKEYPELKDIKDSIYLIMRKYH